MNSFINKFLLSSKQVKEKQIGIYENQIKNILESFNLKAQSVVNKHSVKYIIQILVKKSDITGLNTDFKSKTAVSLYKKDGSSVFEKLKIIKNVLENRILIRNDRFDRLERLERLEKEKMNKEKTGSYQGTTSKFKKEFTSYIPFPDIKDFPDQFGMTSRIMVKLLEQKSNLYNVDDEDKAMNYLDENFCIKNGFKAKLHLVIDYLNKVFFLIDSYGKIVYKKK